MLRRLAELERRALAGVLCFEVAAAAERLAHRQQPHDAPLVVLQSAPNREAFKLISGRRLDEFGPSPFLTVRAKLGCKVYPKSSVQFEELSAAERFG